MRTNIWGLLGVHYEHYTQDKGLIHKRVKAYSIEFYTWPHGHHFHIELGRRYWEWEW